MAKTVNQLLSEQEAPQSTSPIVAPAPPATKSQHKKIKSADDEQGAPGLGGRGGDFEDGARGGQR